MAWQELLLTVFNVMKGGFTSIIDWVVSNLGLVGLVGFLMGIVFMRMWGWIIKNVFFVIAIVVILLVIVFYFTGSTVIVNPSDLNMSQV